MRAALKSYLASIAWLFGTIWKIARNKPHRFLLAVFLMDTLLVMQFLAMMLPLKVVLLAASEGIPSYTPFITPETKFHWIGALAAGAVVAFAISQLLDSVVKRVCDTAGGQLMSESADIQIVPNQRALTGAYFTQMSSIVADGTFFAGSLALYGLIAPLTFAAYVTMVVASFGVASLFVIAKDRWGLGGLHKAVTVHTPSYLSLNNAVIFFVCFLVILLPYFAGWHLNMLVALISIVLLRRTLSALFGAVGTAVKLVAGRHLVDALMFRDKQLVAVKSTHEHTITSMFSPRKRRELVAEILADAGYERTVLDVAWLDPVVRGTLHFMARCDDGSHFHLQVYPRSKSFIAMNEDALFAVMGRESLPAPDLVGETRYGDFVCRLVAAGNGAQPEQRKWNDMLRKSVLRIASIVPKQELVEIYASTRQFPHQVLTSEFVDRIKVALKDKEDRAVFDAFMRDLPALRRKLEELPLSIGLVDVARTQAVMGTGRSDPTFLYWGQWSLEPLGAGIMLHVGTHIYEDHLQQLRKLRADLPAGLTASDLLIARHVQVLILRVEKNAFAAALESIVEIATHQNPIHRTLAAAE